MQNKVEEFRKEAGYSQNRLAQILGVAPNTVLNWEKGGQIKSNNLMQMVALFDCDVNSLLGLPDDDAVCNTA